jgi:cytidylate kinase
VSKFKTARLLVEIKRNTWEASQIFCEYKTVRDCLKELPKFAKMYGLDINDVRVKNLITDQAIADAKQAVYRNEMRRKK